MKAWKAGDEQGCCSIACRDAEMHHAMESVAALCALRGYACALRRAMCLEGLWELKESSNPFGLAALLDMPLACRAYSLGKSEFLKGDCF